MRTLFSLLITLLIGVSLEGCGGVSHRAMPSPTPTPMPSPAPSPSPIPSPTPSTPDSYLAQIFLSVGKNPVSQGQITVDTAANNGAGNLQLNNVGAHLNLILQLCPYPQAFANCINVTSLATDAMGNANVNFQFPQKGAFSGEFQLVDMTGNQFAAAGAGATGVNFHSALLPAGTITGGIAQPTGMAPGLGAVTVTGATAHVALTGTKPNATFSVAICGIFPQTPCTPLSNVTTDMNGNSSMDVGTVQTAGSNIFRLNDAAGVEFVSGFRVQ
jgi:hypothetical protein